MPLDPAVVSFLEQVRSSGLPPLQEMPLEQVRENADALGALATYPDRLARTEDRSIPGPDSDIPVRVYRPEEGLLPVVVYFHGGGFVMGGISSHDAICHQLAVRTPAVVVSVDYRMAPEHPFPAAVEDALAALDWVSSSGEYLGIDPHRLAVAGDSAGGNLAAVAALRARDAGGPIVAFQLLVYPAVELRGTAPSHTSNGSGYLLETQTMEWFRSQYVPDESDWDHPDASPLLAESLSGLPPALVITAEYDPLRDEGEAYAARLRQSGVPATASRYEGMIHGFFGMDAIVPAAGEALDEAATALRAALHPAGS